jgi:hypothetical protein
VKNKVGERQLLGGKMKLKEAIQSYRNEKGAPQNSYEWYRKCAKQKGNIPIGNMNVPAYKQSGIWYIDDNKFAEAIKKHREKMEHLKQVTEDYSKGIIHGNDGDIIETRWGGYKICGGFRFMWSTVETLRGRSNGTWICNKCNIPAETEHNKEECHLCRDWNGCGTDCTLSKVYCSKCGAILNQ